MFGNMSGNFVFNFADLSITAGIIILTYLVIKYRRQREETDMLQKLVEERQELS
jgi:lipoprotein signal peptidase